MVKNAEKFEEEDRIAKGRIDAKNNLNNYIYTMRNTIEDKDKLADKLDDTDKNTIADAITEAEDWLNSNGEADEEDFFEHMKELQRVCDPIIATVYQQ